MKKIIISRDNYIRIFDLADRIKIQKDGEIIGNKYVDSENIKLNSYTSTEEGDIIIRELCYICYDDEIYLYLIKHRYYRIFGKHDSIKDDVLLGLKNKNSVIDFNTMKKRVISLFLKKIILNYKQ